MNADKIIAKLKQLSSYRDQITSVKVLPACDAVHGEVPGGLKEPVQRALATFGIDKLYSHQASAIGKIREGHSVVIVTATASGKTLCYSIPVVESIIGDPLACALCMYPTKALAQDQLRGFNALAGADAGIKFMAGTYDGDTPQTLRRKLRDNGNIILTNPDMLHQGILPQHARWNRFFTHLRYVIIDEVHAYRGVFGSHLANVLKRLSRVCAHYGAQPQFICSSATIANPKDHAQDVCGIPMELVDNDGAPRGPKHFVMWNPPALERAASGPSDDWRAGGDRRSPVGEAVRLLTFLVKQEIQTIAFVRTRLAAELIFKDCRDKLNAVSRRLGGAIHAYRGGYLPEERREIERRLANREILGVASTNALELGIDIGSLDACIMVSYPGSIASLWQQSGRAGRTREESLVFLVADNSPMDQYLMANTGYVFEKNPEQAVVDPENPHIVVGHLKCAAHELPLANDQAESFGQYAAPIMELLQEEHTVSRIDNNWYWANSEYPAAGVSLRNIAGPVYTIQDRSQGEKVIGTLDEVSALSQLHDHAVYLHGADTYFVDKLDIEQKIAFVERRDLDYYTQSVQTSQILIADSLQEDKLLMGSALIGIANVLLEVAPLFVMCDTQDIGVVVDSRNLGRDALFLHDKYPGGMGYARRCMERFGDMIRTAAQVIGNCRCTDGCPSCVGSAVTASAMTDLDSAVRGRIPDKKAARELLRMMLG